MTAAKRPQRSTPQPTAFPSTDNIVVGSGGDTAQRQSEGGWGDLTRGWSLTLVFWGCVKSKGRDHRPRCEVLSTIARTESRPRHPGVCLGGGTANRRSASDHYPPDNRPSGISASGRHAHA